MNEKKILKNYLNDELGVNDDNIDLKLNMKKEEIPSGLLMKNAEKFIDRVYKLLKSKKNITLFTDLDADGWGAAVVLVRLLRKAESLLGNKEELINYVTPTRTEGFGISKKSIDRMMSEFPKTNVVITADNGTVAIEGVEYAKSLGLEVIITDHHTPSGEVADVDILVNHNSEGDGYPYKELISGGTTAWKLMRELYIKYFPYNVAEVDNLIDIQAVTVVSDVMPLLYENRYYVKEALDSFNQINGKRRRFAWNAIMEELILRKKLQKNSLINEESFGFLFAPIINAQSRINNSIDLAVDIFLSTDTDEIRKMAKKLVDVNEQRKEISNAAYEKSNETDFSGKSSVIYRDDSLGDGIIGLLAGKMLEKYYRPTLVFTESEPGILKASGRSIPEVDMLEVLMSLDFTYVRGGGHKSAAGISIKKEDFDDFKEKAEAAFEKAVPDGIRSTVVADILIDSDELSIDVVNEIEKYSPWGQGFRKPLFQVQNLPIDEVRIMGSEKNHLKIISDGMDIIMWNGANNEDDLLGAGCVDVIGSLNKNTFNNQETLQMIIPENGLTIY